MTFSLIDKMQFVQTIAPAITLKRYQEIEFIEINHEVGQAIISLQGAQLLSWKPKQAKQDLLWLSDNEPFKLGNAIRGGVPICYPWFGNRGTPAHGTARISLWTLSNWTVEKEEVSLTFTLYSSQHIAMATLNVLLNENCQLTFTHLATEEAQVALHTYFNVGNIEQTTIFGLPKHCFDSLTQQEINVPSPLTITQGTDSIYSAENKINHLEDREYNRFIEIEHHNASDIVLWNPWHKATSAMSATAYQTMLCLETARIARKLKQGESVSVHLRLQ